MSQVPASTVCGLHRDLNDCTLFFKSVKFTAGLWEGEGTGGDKQLPRGLECVRGVRADGSEASALPEEKRHLPGCSSEGNLQQGAQPELGKKGGQTGKHQMNLSPKAEPRMQGGIVLVGHSEA